jgi:CRP-like cAMP-binding protein
MKSRGSVPEPLATLQLFKGLPAKQLRSVAHLSTPVERPAGTTLAEEGTTGREFFMLLAGEVEVIHGHRLVATRGPGSHLGEIALLEHRPRTATLIAKTPVTIAVASTGEFKTMIHLVPEIAQRLHASTTQRLTQLR